MSKCFNWQLVVFDFFGVLCPDLVDHWIERQGLVDEAAFLRSTYVRPADLGVISFDDECHGLGSRLGLDGDSVARQLLELAILDPATVDVFQELRSHAKLAICSNAPRGLVDRIIEFRGADLRCEAKISSADIGAAKPNPTPYQRVLSAVGCSANVSIMIDDRVANIAGAEALGMKGLQFTSAARLREQLAELGLPF